MRKIVLGDYATLMGIPEKPSKIEWLISRGVENIEGVQIISLKEDMLPHNLLTYHKKLLTLVEKFPFLKRVSVALLCWPLIKDDGGRGGVAASTFLNADLFNYSLGLCQALQKVCEETGIAVDLSYHPMLTVPAENITRKSIIPMWHQRFLWEQEMRMKDAFTELLEFYSINHVGINTENEPVSSDPFGNLIHSGNRLFSEQVQDLPVTWGVTADLQHCCMILQCLQKGIHLAFPPFGHENSNPELWTWEAQFRGLQRVMGDVTFHVSEASDPVLHTKSKIDFSGNDLMDWPTILRLMGELDEDRNGEVWYGIEEDDAHLFPEGYQKDLEALLHLQKYFGK